MSVHQNYNPVDVVDLRDILFCHVLPSAIVGLFPLCLESVAIPTDGCKVTTVCLDVTVICNRHDVVNRLAVRCQLAKGLAVLAQVMIAIKYRLY